MHTRELPLHRRIGGEMGKFEGFLNNFAQTLLLVNFKKCIGFVSLYFFFKAEILPPHFFRFCVSAWLLAIRCYVLLGRWMPRQIYFWIYGAISLKCSGISNYSLWQVA